MPRKPGTTKYNETFFRNWAGPGPAVIGSIVIILVVIGVWLAFTKELPFQSPGYQLKATFANAVNISDKAPVRIAGVGVGQVTGLERKGNSSVVTFTVSDSGRPIHSDASATIRPRIFLEGNFFIELDPGSPSAPEMPDKATIPITRTATAVQLDQLLTAAATARAHQPAAAADRLRHRADPSADPGRGQDAGSRRPGRERGHSAQPDLRLRRRRQPRVGDCQRGAAGRAARRPLPAARRRQPDLQDAGEQGDAAPGADLKPRHLHRGTRGAVGQPLGVDPAAGADPRHGEAVARRPQRRPAGPAGLCDRGPAGDRRAAGDDQRCPALAEAGQATAQQARAGRNRLAAGARHPAAQQRNPGDPRPAPATHQVQPLRHPQPDPGRKRRPPGQLRPL